MQRHMVWLLWLALLLPLAQTAANWHILSHVNPEQASETPDQAIHQAHCDLCLSAAALIGGAPLASLPDLPQARALIEAFIANLRGVVRAPTVRAYESRAPPFLQP